MQDSVKGSVRREKIADLVAAEGDVSVDDLALRSGVSVETIRRDLTKLEEQGVLRKVHGGARHIPGRQRLHVEAPFEARMDEEREAKEHLAQKLTQVVTPGETIFLDTGSTTLIACSVLTGIPGLTVITNSVAAADALTTTGNTRVYLLGGAYGQSNSQTVGPMVVEQIGRFRADHAILTPTGVDAEMGVTDADPDEAEVARAMIKGAQSVCFLTVPSKFGRCAGFHVCDLEDVSVVLTEGTPPSTHYSALKAAGVTLL
ncbi:DeoR/GlpR family DNA-binding transcription regulator [Chachezhania sediminis]|uniref:DeoR/GlpR family DNA-binding transcription regulator n=1 Tax=Chachezhania sediminis TaxID=2599291 RepID=UPI001E3762AB|nr:DeoR/GlpR family DNA-binding transcription regulator [Chachezhania sediminis]